MPKPTRAEFREAVRTLVRWIALSGERYETHNPYTFKVVREAMILLAREHGLKDYLDVPLRLGKEGENDRVNS